MRKWVAILLVFVLTALAAAWFAYADLQRYAATPAKTGAQAAGRIITVAKGQNFGRTTQLMHAHHLIEHPFKFRLLARLQGKDKQIQAGEYLLSAAMSPADILEALVTGKVRLYRFTVPEGSNLKQIAAIVATAGLGSPAEFLGAATDVEFAKAKGIAAASFEGYLFPDTYFFPKNAPAREIIAVMVDRLRTELTPAWEKERLISACRFTKCSPWPRSSRRKPARPSSDRSSHRCSTTACGGGCALKPIRRSSTASKTSTAT